MFHIVSLFMCFDLKVALVGCCLAIQPVLVESGRFWQAGRSGCCLLEGTSVAHICTTQQPSSKRQESEVILPSSRSLFLFIFVAFEI